MAKAGRVQHWKHGWIPLDGYARAQTVGRPTDGQLAALQPRPGGWTTSTRAKTLAELKTTPEGRRLVAAIDSYQNSSAAAIPRMRTDITKHLTGGELPEGRHESIQTLLNAIEASKTSRPLYRGMVVPGTPAAVLAQYAPGSEQSTPLASFTLDPKIATSYSIRGAGQRIHSATTTPVILEWQGEKRALPIENLAPSRIFADEREHLASGSFRVKDARLARRGGRQVVLVQVGQG